jgi:membrane protease YdiL (CAAX protease family)
MKKFLIKNGWWFYFILTCLISWPVWTAGKLLLPESLFSVTLIAGAFGPFLSAVIIQRITGGGLSLKNWLTSTFNFRIKPIWFLMGGIILPFAIAAAHHLLYLILGGSSGIEISPAWLIYFVYLISTTLLSGGNEEPGWRGFITPVLLERFNPVTACTLTATGWAIWHLPMYFLAGWGGNNQPFIWLLIYCIPLSMILTWLYFRSGKSIIPVMLLHAGTNVVFQYFPMNTQLFENIADEFTVIKTAIYWLFAVIILILTKGSLGYSKQ